MDLASFYGSILPLVSLRVLAVFKNGLGAPPTHLFFDNNDDLIQAAQTYDGLKKNVYHACAGYATNANRKGENVAAVKTLWVDLDVGPTKPYESQKAAVADLERFRREVGLLQPHIVLSGFGVHAYFAFTKPIAPDQWQRLASMFAQCLDHYGVKHDSSRTQDRASILRVPETHNYKNETIKSVRLIAAGEEDQAAAIYKKLANYAQVNEILLLENKNTSPAANQTKTNELVGEVTYPPSEGDLIAAKCQIIKDVAKTGGDTSYEIWWRAIGVAKHTTTPDETAARWTRERENTGHDKADWQAVLDAWNVGPTTCADFSKHSDKCKTCEFNGSIKSPIQLGVSEVPVAEPLLTEAPNRMIGPWEFGAQWILDRVQKSKKIGYHKGKLIFTAEIEQGVFKEQAFTDRYWQVMRRVRGVDHTWQLEIGYTEYIGKPYRTFLLDSEAVTSPDMLKKAFSARELHIYGGQKGMAKAQELLMYQQELLAESEAETTTFPVLGWATHNNTARGEMTGDFVIGNTLLAPKRRPRQVLLDNNMHEDYRHDFGTKGSTEEWIMHINRIYNRPGAEPYQFVIAASFAAPLVKLVPSEGDWHGIPIALYGASGAAKTSTALVAMSLYARPSLLMINAQSSKDGQGDTINAFARKIGTLQNLPFIADEMTNLDPEKMSSIMYMLANGKMRDRASPTGQTIPNPYRWDTLSIATGNDEFHDKLHQLQNMETQEATKLRCFQIRLRIEDIQEIFHDVSRAEISQTLLAEQYGCAGRDWLQFVVNNRLKIEEYLGKRRMTYKISDNDPSSLRFYKDLLLTIEVAAELAQRKGFIKWDIGAMMRWARRYSEVLAEGVYDRDTDSMVADFIGSLHGRTIVTKRINLSRGRRSAKNAEMPLDPILPGQPPIARRAIDDKLFFVAVSHLNNWCKNNKVGAGTLIGAMFDRGMLKASNPLKPEHRLIRLGSDTTVATAQSPCFELDYVQVIESTQRGDNMPDNVVELRPNDANSSVAQVAHEGTDQADTV